MAVEVIVHFSVLKVHRGGGDGRGEVCRLLHANADTAILVETVEDVSLLTRHYLVEGGGVSLGMNNTNSLFHVCIDDDDFSWVQEEELVAGGRGEQHLKAVVE